MKWYEYATLRHFLLAFFVVTMVVVFVRGCSPYAQTLMTDGRILVSVDTAWKVYYPEEWAGPARHEGFYGIDSIVEDSSNWWCEVVCDTVYDGSLRWDSTVFTGRDGRVFGTLYPCDTTWHRKQCLMLTPEEERALKEWFRNIRKYHRGPSDSTKEGKT